MLCGSTPECRTRLFFSDSETPDILILSDNPLFAALTEILSILTKINSLDLVEINSLDLAEINSLDLAQINSLDLTEINSLDLIEINSSGLIET